MRLFEIETNQFDDAQRIIELIKAKCKPWLGSTNNNNFEVYRGVGPSQSGKISDFTKHAFIASPREDRKPKDSTPGKHNLFNAAIEQAGYVANRSNSFFVSGKQSIAKVYGKTYNIIPIGDFKFTWSPKWIDWATGSSLTDLVDLSTNSGGYSLLLQKAEEVFDRDIRELAVDVQSAKDSGNEYRYQSLLGYYNGRIQKRDQMISHEVYRLVTYDDDAEYISQLKFEESGLRELIRDDYLTDAILSDKEIMLYCQSAIMIKSDFYSDYIRGGFNETI